MTCSQTAPVASGPQARDSRARKGGPKSQTNPPSTVSNSAPAESVRTGPEVTLMSPVTPGSDFLPAAPLLNSQVTVANKPSDPPPPAALPSPVPSTDSHPSPIISHNNIPARTPDAASQASDGRAVVAQPADSCPTTLPQPSSRLEIGQDSIQAIAEATIALSSESRRATPVQAPSPVATSRDQVSSPAARESPYQSPFRTSPALSQPEGNPPAGAQRRLHSEEPALPDDIILKQWKASFEQLKAETTKFPFSPVISGRMTLLEEAFDKSDVLYLVLHQVYCRWSVDASVFRGLRGMHWLSGLDKFSSLLQSNAKIPEHLVWSFANFPSKVEDLRHEAWFSTTINRVSQLLYSVSTNLFRERDRIVQEHRARGYPPLACEMRTEFQVGSPVLLIVIFTSICRELYTDENVMKLNTLFRLDLSINAQLLQACRRNMQQQTAALTQQLHGIVEEYKKIPMKRGARPPLTNSAHPAFLSPQTQTMSSRATGPPTAGSQPTVASPMVPTSAHLPTTSNSPQAVMVQDSGYFDHHAHLSQQQQQQQMQMQIHQHQQQQMQQQTGLQMQSPQQWQAMQTGSFHPQGQTALSSPMQGVPQRQSQLAYTGQAPPSAHSDPAQYVVQAQRPHSYSFPNPGSAVVSSQHPPRRWPTQVAQQQGAHSSDSQRVNMSNRLNTAQGTPQQTPRGQFGQQTAMPPHQAASQAIQARSAPYPQRPPGPLLPPAGYRAPITVGPNPMRLGIHQADLRDPVKKLVKPGPNGELIETELYHFQGNFLLAPQPIEPNAHSYNWNFTLSEEDWARLPLLQEPGEGQRPVRTFKPGCRSFRLRSITLCGSEEKDSVLLWPTRATTWPSVFYILVNDVEMFVRRKVHNGKDLPLDITKHLKLGENKVVVHFLLGEKECEDFKYFFGIERMVTTVYEHAQGAVGFMSADKTRQIIRDRLTPSADDDDVAFITDNITISLVDPFMAQIFNVPARSMNCTHLECFDLETFLRTRKSDSGPAPFNDNWRCPICYSDARPQCLRVDNFLVEVRNELVRTQRLEAANAIQVKADGTWTLKVFQDESAVSPHQSRSTSVSAKRKAESIPDPGPGASRSKTENTPDRNTHVHQERLVIEID